MSIEIVKDLGMRYNDVSKRNFRWHLVRCTCGTEWETRNATRIQHCNSCANKLAGKAREKHGLHKHRLNTIYRSMKDRCYNPNNTSYSLYGGKGVYVCDEWLESFVSFYNWAIANGYSDDKDLDKDELSNKLGLEVKKYSPETCIWKPKAKNSVTNRKITIKQEQEICDKYPKLTIASLAKEYKLSWNGIKAILIRNNQYTAKN